MTFDAAQVEEFAGRVLADTAAAESTVANYLGDRLGLYQAMAGAGAVTADQLADRTGTAPRLVREWLDNQTAGTYVVHDPDDDTYALPDEHAAVLADQDSPAYLAGFFDIVAAMWADADDVAEAMANDGGLAWGDHDERLYRGVERVFAPAYRANLTTEWVPALDGVEDDLARGGRVADLGCGLGTSTIEMARAYPEARFVGVDLHQESIATARQAAADTGVADRVELRVGSAADFADDGFDLVCFFDSLHDMGDPVGAARQARRALRPDGHLLVVEPLAADEVDDNINPVSRLYYAGSLVLCTPNALSQDGDLHLGAQAGPDTLVDVLRQAGFGDARLAAETAVNMVLTATP